MRPEDLFKIIGEIDDALIAESEELYAGEAGRQTSQANMVGATGGTDSTEYSPLGKKETRPDYDEAEKGDRGPSSTTRRFRPRRWIPAVAAAACVLVGFAGLYALMRPKGSAMSEAAYEEAMVEEAAEEPMAEEAAEGAAEYAYEEAAPAAESASPSAEDKEEMSENFASEPTEEAATESDEEDVSSGIDSGAGPGSAAGEGIGSGQAGTGGGSFSGDAADAAAVGVTLEASDVTSTGLTLTCTQSGGRMTGELITGTSYTLEQLDPAYLRAYKSGDEVPSDAWRAVDPLVEEIVWTEEGLPITLGGKTEWTVNWEPLYGELDKGTYRICKQILDLRAPGDYDAYEAGAVFEIK